MAEIISPGQTAAQLCLQMSLREIRINCQHARQASGVNLASSVIASALLLPCRPDA